MANASSSAPVHPSTTTDSRPNGNRTEWLDARSRFRDAASKIMFAELLYPEGTRPAPEVQEHLHRSYLEHVDAAYELLRRTERISNAESSLEMAQRLLENLNIKVDSATDISMLTLAIDKNEEALKDIREAADALLYFIGRERATLQTLHRGELFKN